MSSISNIQTGNHPHQVQPVAAPTPTQQVVDEANRIVYTTDALGRTLGVTRINAKLQRRVFKALSSESAEKTRYLMQALTVCACVSIDGTPVAFPTSELQIDALIDRLEQEGLDAIALCLATNFSRVAKEELKNS